MTQSLDFLKPLFEELTLIERNDSHKISYFEKHSDEVIISFSSTPRMGDNEGHEQFIGTMSKEGKTAIFIIDLDSSYGNNLDWDRIVELITPIISGRKVYAVGYCMGGFLATVLSKYIDVEAVVAITPQYSIHPDYMPDYSFLRIWADRVKKWNIKSLDGYFNDTTKYYVFGSEHRDDLDQLAMFPSMPNITTFMFPDTAHDLPEVLGEDLNRLMMLCINGKPEVVDHYARNSLYKNLSAIDLT